MASILGKRKQPSRLRPWARSMVRRTGRYLVPSRRGGVRGNISSFNRSSPTGIDKNRMVWRGNGVIPMRFDTIFQYAYPWKYSTAGGFQDWVIRGNSIYDPDVAIGGEMAAGLDQMKNLYLNYKVSYSTCEVTAVNNDTDDPIYITIVPTTYSNAIGVANAYSVASQPYAKTITVANQAGQAKIHNAMSSKTMFGVKNLDSVNFQAAYNANPATMWYWHIVIWNNSTNALNVELNMKCKFFTELSGHSYLDQ